MMDQVAQEWVRRLMGEKGLQAPPGAAVRGPRIHGGTIIPRTLNTMCGTDMPAACICVGGQAAVFVAVDLASAGCVGSHAALHGTRHEALEPIRQSVAQR